MVTIMHHRRILEPKVLVTPSLPRFVVVYAVAELDSLPRKLEKARILHILVTADAIAILYVLGPELMIAHFFHLLA